MLIGYARISTDDQNLNLQQDSLKQAGCETIFEDTLSGAIIHRPGLVDALKFFQENGEVCPANWSKGKKGMKANSKGVAEYLEHNASGL